MTIAPGAGASYSYSGGIANTAGTAATLGIAINGPGKQEFSGNGIIYNGPTIISQGTLELFSCGSFPSQAGPTGTTGITNNGTLQLDGNETIPCYNTMTFTISGSGSILKTGTGSVTLSGSNSYSGPTTVNSGTLVLGSSGAILDSAITLGSAGTLQNNTSSEVVPSIVGNGVLYVNNNMSIGGNEASSTFGGSMIGGAALTIPANTSLTGSSTGTQLWTVGAIAGSGSLGVIGPGTLLLTGSDTYTGGTTISSGTLQLGDGAANNGYVQGIVADNSNLVFANPSAQTFSGQITGSGSLTKLGNGMLTLTGTNTYTGVTTVSGGSLAGNTLTLPTAVSLFNGGNVSFNQNVPGTFSLPISGAGTSPWPAAAS